MSNSALRSFIDRPSVRIIFLTYLALCLGAVLRFYQYLANRSLWYDEALLSLNIVNRSFMELTRPLDFDQGAPVGFLWIVKAATVLFGPGEYALRLFPFISGLLSLLIFFLIARSYLNVRAVFFGLLLFAISEPLIYYASEVKQYSSDVLISLMALMMLTPFLKKKLNLLIVLLYGVLGAIFIWLSHPVLFVLASIGLISVNVAYLNKDYRKIGFLLLISIFWLISFFFSYVVSLRQLAENQILLNYWTGGFAPPISTPGLFLTWFVGSFLALFESPVGLPLTGLAMVAYLVGAVSYFHKDTPRLLALLLPVFLTMLAAVLGKYPFSGRLLLFSTPLIILLVAEGIDRLLDLFLLNNLRIVALFFLLLFFYYPLFQATTYISGPTLREEIKPAIAYVDAHWQPQDILYLYYASYRPFEYYSSRYNFESDEYIAGVSSRNNWTAYLKELDNLQTYRRVWLLFSHVHAGSGVNEELLFLNYLKSIGGVQKDQFQTTGAAAYLYEFE